MLGHAELARMDAGENPNLQESLDEILKGGNRAKELVQQILLFSRRQATELRPIRLQPVVAEVMKLLKSTLPSTLTTTCQIAEDAPAIMGDSTQIHQVLVNLCTNSAHAMQGTSGRLDVQLDTIEIDSASQTSTPELKSGLYCRLTVSDTGHGISEATQKRIFEPFFTTKKLGEGTGLGLSVVHGIIHDHSGNIKVQSEPGKGTVFTVLLPAISSESAIESEAKETIVRGRGEPILWVDDEAPIGKSVALLLRRNGYQVTAITNPQDAYNLFVATPLAFDLVVTDLTMPGMTGVELAKKILNVRPNQAILLSTGFSDVWTEENLKELGLRGLLLKPFDSLSLSQKISAVLSESRGSGRSV